MPVRLREAPTGHYLAPMRTVGVFVFVVVGLLCVAGCSTSSSETPQDQLKSAAYTDIRANVAKFANASDEELDTVTLQQCQALDKAGKQGKGALAVVKVDVGLGLTGGEAMALVVDSADAGCLDQLPSFAATTGP